VFCDAVERKVKDDEGKDHIESVRVMSCHPSAAAIAGGRMSDRLPKVMKLSYDSLLRYLPETTAPEGEHTEPEDDPDIGVEVEEGSDDTSEDTGGSESPTADD
jgi:hypothetical protein